MVLALNDVKELTAENENIFLKSEALFDTKVGAGKTWLSDTMEGFGNSLLLGLDMDIKVVVGMVWLVLVVVS